MNPALAAAALDALAACPLSPRGAAIPAPYRETLALADGRSVLLRPAHHRDAAALQRFVAGLSPRARLLRFHGGVARLPDGVARAMSTQVAARHVALLALDASEIVAEARYAVDGGEAEAGVAEFGIAVGDAWQGRGLGRALLLRLAFHARASGFVAVRGSVMPGNEPMLALLRAFGAELRGGAAEIQGTIALQPAYEPA